MASTNTTANTQPRRFQCRHVFTDGRRCGSPCLRHEDFCFYHLGLHAQKPTVTTDLSQGEHRASPFTLPVPDFNDRGALQLAIGEVLNRLASNQLDPRRAGLILYGLQIASLNLPRVPAAPAQQDANLVEEIVSHPDLGPIALRTELPDPGAPRPNSLIARLLEALELGQEPPTDTPTPEPESQPEPEPKPAADPTPATLPDLQAATEPTPATLPNLQAATEPTPTTLSNLQAATGPGAPSSPAVPSPERVGSGATAINVPGALAILEGHAQTHRPHHPRRLGLPPRDPRQRHRTGPQTRLRQAPPRLPQHPPSR